MYEIRRQLTLFISGRNETIEKIRAEFNPKQFDLIPAHVTLCREDEIGSIEIVIENIKSIIWEEPLQIAFNAPIRYNDGKGVLIPGKMKDTAFNNLRNAVLKGLNEFPREHVPHVTLMHSRNSTCTDLIFEQIRKYKLPAKLSFDTISLIEQKDAGQWLIIKQFPITSAGQLNKNTIDPIVSFRSIVK